VFFITNYQGITTVQKYIDLAPEIIRQRLVIEGYPGFKITDKHIVEYLSELSDVLGMKTLIKPVTHKSDTYGWAGWIHWETSGAHFYAWDKPKLFFSVDIYTCKTFNSDDANAFTRKYFKTKRLTSLSFDSNLNNVAGVSTKQFEFKPRYDLTRNEVHNLTKDYLAQPNLPRGRFVGIYATGNDKISNAGRWLERDVFEDTFNHDEKEMADLYGTVENDSFFLIVFDRRKRLPAGVMRLVGGNAAYGLTLAEAPTYLPFTEKQIKKYHGISDGEKAWDVATMAIAKEYRGKIVSQVAVSGLLERMFGLLGDKENIKHVFTMLDAKARRSFDSIGIPFREMHGHMESFPYKNSPATYAMYGRYAEFREGVVKRHEEIRQESLFVNVVRMGWKKAIHRRVTGRVAGMAVHGKGGIDRHIVHHTL
jgi:S-adenosylmethionine decarboxylase